MKRVFFLVILLLVALPVYAQDATETPTPEPDIFPFAFPLAAPTVAQIDDAYDCVLVVELTDVAAPSGEITPACGLANTALALAAERGDDEAPSDEELALFTQLVEANPALALRLTLIAAYYSATPLVAPPDFAAQPITDVHVTYTFAGMGPSNDYTVSISDDDGVFVVMGAVEIRGVDEDEQPTLPVTVSADIVQAFGPALRDLVPIAAQFTSIACLDYYPDWTVDVTFADGTTLHMATNQSNVVGIGGPWQTEIDGVNYMQYSSAFSVVVFDLFEALDLPFGVTGGMACMGMNDPLFDAFPRADDGA